MTELSDYEHDNQLNESTLMQMPVPQGPGSALRFMGGLLAEESTCFTPNFQPAQTTQQTNTQTEQSNVWSSNVASCDFDFNSVSSPEESNEPKGSSKLVAMKEQEASSTSYPCLHESKTSTADAQRTSLLSET